MHPNFAASLFVLLKQGEWVQIGMRKFTFVHQIQQRVRKQWEIMMRDGRAF